MLLLVFFFSSRRRHTRWTGDWSSDVCSSDLQLKWFAYAAGVSVALLILAIPATTLSPTLSNAMFGAAFSFGFAFMVPAAAALAILRYGLYEIDVVINKTIVYGLLAAFFTAVYVAVVVG